MKRPQTEKVVNKLYRNGAFTKERAFYGTSDFYYYLTPETFYGKHIIIIGCIYCKLSSMHPRCLTNTCVSRVILPVVITVKDLLPYHVCMANLANLLESPFQPNTNDRKFSAV